MKFVKVRPPLRYVGSKSTIADWVCSLIPVQHEHYVEPCGGGAAVLLAKEPSALETYNDVNGDVVRFFRTLRQRPRALVRALELTPYSRAEFELSCEPLTGLDDLEHARRYMVRSWFSLGMTSTPKKSDWRYEVAKPQYASSAAIWSRRDAFAHLFVHAERLRHVALEQGDLFDVVRRYDRPETFFYIDPPYLDSVVKSGKGKKAYETLWTEAEHVRLLEVVLGAKGMSMVSGYTSPLYEAMLEGAGWARADTVKPGRSKHMTERTESIWLHPRIGERLAGQLF